jgi:hypothetical protein
VKSELCSYWDLLSFKIRGVAQLARALRSGRRGRGFKSHHPDHITSAYDC